MFPHRRRQFPRKNRSGRHLRAHRAECAVLLGRAIRRRAFIDAWAFVPARFARIRSGMRSLFSRHVHAWRLVAFSATSSFGSSGTMWRPLRSRQIPDLLSCWRHRGDLCAIFRVADRRAQCGRIGRHRRRARRLYPHVSAIASERAARPADRRHAGFRRTRPVDRVAAFQWRPPRLLPRPTKSSGGVAYMAHVGGFIVRHPHMTFLFEWLEQF